MRRGWLLWAWTLLAVPPARVCQFFSEVPEELCTYEAPKYKAGETKTERLYLDLLANVITGLAYAGTEERSQHHGIGSRETLRKGRLELRNRVCGNDLPYLGLTMTGLRRMQALEGSLRAVVDKGVAGDAVECGVWQGGASAYIIAILRRLGWQGTAWLADSYGGFKGLKTMREDSGFDLLPVDVWAGADFIAVHEDTVRENLRWLGLYQKDRMRFAKGFFNESLGRVAEEVGAIAVLRMDGDLYESTMDILYHLYSKVSLGGLVIVDDWWIENTRAACEEFRLLHGVTEPVRPIDQGASFWVKRRHVTVDPHSWLRQRSRHF